MRDAPGLTLMSESPHPSPVSAHLVAGSPTIDLAVTVSDEDSTLFIRRPGGELVSKHTERNRKVQALRWKPDGQFLAVGWSDGVVRLMGLENSKAVHHIRAFDNDHSGFTYIGWSRNLAGKRRTGAPKKPALETETSMSYDDLAAGGEEDLYDLERDLTFLEVETAVPKLSPLPVSGGSGDDMFVFSTRTSLEFVFQPLKSKDHDAVDVMLAGTADGNIHLSIYDTFTIGVFNAKSSPELQGAKQLGPLQLRYHASHQEIPSYPLLLSPADPEGHAFYLVLMDLTFIHSSPVNLSLLASKTTTLQKLLRYVKQAQVHMAAEWQSTRELPTRFLAGVQEDLEKRESGPKNIVDALYHTVVTGHAFPQLKEWLVDSLAERGHKRWDKAVVSGLENLRDLVHQNMIPALERCAIILSRLLGLARFYDHQGNIGFTVAQVTRLMDIVSCLSLVAHKIMLAAMDELELFTTFSTWLRLEIDKLASSTLSEELTEKEATIDNSRVLQYIQRYLAVSPMAIYLGKVDKEARQRDMAVVDDGVSLLDMLDKQLRRHDAGAEHMTAFPNVDFLVDYLSTRAAVVFRDIAEAERRSVHFGKMTRLDIASPISRFDVHMTALPKTEPKRADGLALTALTSKTAKSDVYLFRHEIPVVSGLSSAVSTTAYGLTLTGGTVVDVKFLNANILIALWCEKANPARIIAIPVQGSKIRYAPYTGDSSSAGANGPSFPMGVPTTEGLLAAFWSAEIPGALAGGFTLAQMEVMPASSARGDLPARVCLLGADRVSYKVFALPPESEMLRP